MEGREEGRGRRGRGNTEIGVIGNEDYGYTEYASMYTLDIYRFRSKFIQNYTEHMCLYIYM